MFEQPRHVEFFVLSYVPKDSSFINIAVLVLERQHGHLCFAKARILDDLDRVLAFDPEADLDLLSSLLHDIERQFEHLEDAEAFLRMMQESFSNAIQISERKSVVISGDPAVEVDELAAHYLFSGNSVG